MTTLFKQFRRGASLAATGLLLVAPAFGQAIFGSINGNVTDSTGAAVPNATVTVTDLAKGTSVTLKSNDSGEFTADHLIPDVYTVKVAATGFKTFQQTQITLFADTATKVTAALEIGAADQTIEVNADQVPQLKADRADVATTFSAQEIVELPIPDRNFTNLQLLLPGAQQLGWGHAASENPQGSKQIEVDGQAFAGVSYQLDGTDNQDPLLGIIVINPNVDSLSEAKITTQNFDAEFGKAVSSVVTVQTKSGSNKFHGSAFDYRESNANLATDPFTQPRSSLTATNPFPGGLKNQFGGSLGGPILKDRLFFFLDYQGVRQKVGLANLETVPTNLVYTSCLSGTGCDFSEYTKQFGKANTKNTAACGTGVAYIFDNSTGNGCPFPNSIIPNGRLSPQFLAFLKQLSVYKPNTAGSLGGLVNNYAASGQGSLNDDQYDVRVDYSLSQSIHAFGRFSRFTDLLSGSPIFGQAGGKGFGLNGYSGSSQGKNTSAAAGVDVAVNSKLVFDVRLGYFRYNITTHKYDEGVQYATLLGIPNLNKGDIITSGAPGFFLADPGSYGNSNNSSVYGQGLGFTHCNCPLTEHEDQYQLANNWTKTLGNHAVKFGVDLRYARNLRVPSDTDRTGALNIGTGPTGDGSGSNGLSFATFALGEVPTFGRFVSTSTNAKEFQKRAFGYAQDTWRAKSNLTLNLGLRYEYYAPETINAPSNGSLLNLATGYLQVAGVGSVASDMNIAAPKYAFNPRLGVAWEAKPGTVIRAGYGRSFDIGVFGSVFGHAATQNLPVLAGQSLVAPGGDSATNTNYAFTLAQGPSNPTFITSPASGQLPNPGNAVSSFARPTTERLPTLDAWNMAVQQAIGSSWSTTLAYVANKGTHTLGDQSGQQTNPNEPGDFLPAQYSINGQALHYDPSVATGISANNGTSNVNYLQRYYGVKLPACSDVNYAAAGGINAANGGCGWTNGIKYLGDDMDTHYNAMQATITKNLSHGYSLNVSYAWQKAISEATGYSTWDRAVVRGRDGCSASAAGHRLRAPPASLRCTQAVPESLERNREPDCGWMGDQPGHQLFQWFAIHPQLQQLHGLQRQWRTVLCERRHQQLPLAAERASRSEPHVLPGVRA
uniref:TonB-dependent receptor domain-containing protein n=1 Tax=Granulicella tundricola TaxID=940615 RepID=UPI0001DB76C9|nr:TonB-dependent receptor [Granulicella tundricola]